MVKIDVKPGESFDEAYRKFKQLCNQEGIFLEFRKHAFFIDGTTRRKIKMNEYMKRHRRRWLKFLRKFRKK
jgi:ribosomal protein S21